MQIVLYEDNIVVDVFTEAKDISITNEAIIWDSGELRGLKTSFLILDDTEDIYISDTVTQELLDKDKSKEYEITEEVTVEDIKKALDIILKSGGRK